MASKPRNQASNRYLRPDQRYDMATEHERSLDLARKQKHFRRKYAAAPLVACACGCGQQMKSIDHYARPKKFINGHNRRKYDDRRQYRREWNKRNRPYRRRVKLKRHHMLKARLITLNGGVCTDCHIKYNGSNAAIFHFHHIDPSTKTFALGNQLTNFAWSRILAEASKCKMICANCHEIAHSTAF
jgi:hypothetical protein